MNEKLKAIDGSDIVKLKFKIPNEFLSMNLTYVLLKLGNIESRFWNYPNSEFH